MPWNEADRSKYEVIRERYTSDMSAAEFALIEPVLPPRKRRGRKPTDALIILNALFYLIRAGCPWRYLPNDFPPKSTVWRYFDQWRHDGTLDRIHDRLRRRVRAEEKPDSPRTSASVDSQSVDTTSGGEERGRDNAKNVAGRKRHLVVDSLGLLLAVLVTAGRWGRCRGRQSIVRPPGRSAAEPGEAAGSTHLKYHISLQYHL